MQPPYRVLIVDDERPARQLVRGFIERIFDLVCVGECNRAEDALDAVAELAPDLLILDIEMQEISGLDMLSGVKNFRPKVIFITGHIEYGAQSYEYSAIDYLIKPVPFERFAQSIAKFRSRISPVITDQSMGNEFSFQGKLLENHYSKSVQEEFSIPRSVWLREEKRIMQIQLDEIHYVEGLKDYIKVFFKDQVLLTHMTIGVAESLFLPPAFIRIHRSHIVRIDSIKNIDGNTVVLSNGIELVIGPSYRERLKIYIPLLK